MNIVPHMPKGARYTLGARIETKFLDLLELSYITYFSERETKREKLSQCILMLDVLKFLIAVAWEGKLVSHAQFEGIGIKLDEVGKMFGGWRKNLEVPVQKNRAG